ncbi:MAG: tRNA pseudouridine(13) synthase TruD [Candidatus Aenigmarchaeota archaeon]|nr:tRNA pseudouridine(13) synthase TruD [Candidatus Aenigmarchaeota archaeon]
MNKLCTNGNIESPEDFVVEEVINPKFLRKHERAFGKIKKVEGPYSLFMLRKRNMTTEDALKTVSEKLGINVSSIGYAGLKDKFAFTSQHVTIKDEENKLGGFCEQRTDVPKVRQYTLSLEKIGRTNRHISLGDLSCNKFTITLHDCKNLEKIEKILDFVKKPVPNYFGPQRFSHNNVEVGRKLLQRKIEARKLTKEKAKFLVNAYQSYVFNMALGKSLKNTPKALPLVGCDSKKLPAIVRRLLENDKISPKDFAFGAFSCSGGLRETFIKIQDFNYSIEGDILCLEFTLPKGSYATIVFNKIQKGKWICQ